MRVSRLVEIFDKILGLFYNTKLEIAIFCYKFLCFDIIAIAPLPRRNKIRAKMRANPRLLPTKSIRSLILNKATRFPFSKHFIVPDQVVPNMVAPVFPRMTAAIFHVRMVDVPLGQSPVHTAIYFQIPILRAAIEMNNRHITLPAYGHV